MRNPISIVLLWLLSLLTIGCKTEETVAEPTLPAIPVTTASIEINEITDYLEEIGTLQPSALVEIRPQVSGSLQMILVSEGEWVNPGAPLFKIDPIFYEIKVQEAEAQLAMDQAEYRGVVKKLTRFKELAQKDLISKSEWDDLEERKERSQASILLDQARLNTAKLDLDHCTLRSPVEGRVGKIDLHAGSLVSAGQTAPLAAICKMDPLIVEFSVTEKEYPKMPKGEIALDIVSLCDGSLCKSGSLTFLDNHFDAKTGLLLVRGKVPNVDQLFWPGQTIRVRIPIFTDSRAVLIPQKAIRYNQQGPYVYVVQEDNTVALRQIKVGKEYGEKQVVLEEIDPSTLIILEGHLRLSPGAKVEIKS